MLYVVSPLSEKGVSLSRHLAVPEVLRCSELHRSIHEARLWMSGGNTTSSLHLDTHDNLLMQMDGTKEVLLWHPEESHKFYSDFHNKFGLSPISADRVDLERYPALGRARGLEAIIKPGEVLWLPGFVWHYVRQLDEGRHNLSLNKTTGAVTKLDITFESHPATQLPRFINIKIRDVIKVAITNINHTTTRSRETNLIILHNKVFIVMSSAVIKI